MQSTKISNFFIDNHFKNANPSFIIVYVLLLRLSENGACGISDAADALCVMESDIRRALNYWAEKGVLAFDDENGTLKIDFFLENERTADAAPKPDFARTAVIAVSRPVYSAKEIDYCMETSPSLRQLFKSCENRMGKLLTYNDMCALFSFHDWLRMPFELIELLVQYCCSNGHNSIRYIEKVAVTWADAGIDTVEKAKARIKLYNTDFRRIMQALGKSDREPIKAEEEYMLKWIKSYKMPLDVIEAACERTVLQTSRPGFKYADTIIERWAKSGLTTLEGIERAEAAFRAAEPENSPKKAAAKPSKAKFSNFKERKTTDFSEIQRLEMERINKELGISE